MTTYTDKAQRYLDAHPDLKDVLVEAYGHIALHFPETVQYHLDYDPAITALVLSIVTSQPSDEAHPCLMKFDDEWWLEHVHPDLCITLAFAEEEQHNGESR